MSLMPILFVEIKLVVWISRILEPKMFSWEFLDYQEIDAKKNNNVFFSVEFSFTCAIFSMQISMEKIKLVVAKNSKFEYRAKSK